MSRLELTEYSETQESFGFFADSDFKLNCSELEIIKSILDLDSINIDEMFVYVGEKNEYGRYNHIKICKDYGDIEESYTTGESKGFYISLYVDNEEFDYDFSGNAEIVDGLPMDITPLKEGLEIEDGFKYSVGITVQNGKLFICSHDKTLNERISSNLD